MQLRQFIVSAVVAAVLLAGQQLYGGVSAGEFRDITVRSTAYGLGGGIGGAIGWRLGSAIWDGATYVPRYLWRKGKVWNARRAKRKAAAVSAQDERPKKKAKGSDANDEESAAKPASTGTTSSAEEAGSSKAAAAS